MSFEIDLLEQARHLLQRESKKPKQVSLRRAISASYYALFHLLIGESAKRIKCPGDIQNSIRRIPTHNEIKKLCERTVKDPTLPPLLREIAKDFVQLHEARHQADYNLSLTFTRTETDVWVRRAEQSFRNWQKVRSDPNTDKFLIQILFGDRFKG